jgi:hypothetical protein
VAIGTARERLIWVRPTTVRPATRPSMGRATRGPDAS